MSFTTAILHGLLIQDAASEASKEAETSAIMAQVTGELAAGLKEYPGWATSERR